MNGIKTMYWENGKPIKLDEFLSKNKSNLKNKLGFYMLSSVAEPDVIKYGICIKNDAYGRLNSYVISYGYHKRNSKSGCNLLYFGTTNFNKNVYFVNSRIYKTEKFLKQYFRKKKITIRGRGTERVRVTANTIMSLVNSKGKVGDDEIITPKRSTRGKFMYDIKKDDEVFLKWTKQDVAENGGTVGNYRVLINKITNKNVDITYIEDGYETIMSRSEFEDKVVK